MIIPRSYGIIILKSIQNVFHIIIEFLEFTRFLNLMGLLYISNHCVELKQGIPLNNIHTYIYCLKKSFTEIASKQSKYYLKLTPLAFLLHRMLVMASASSSCFAPAVGQVTTLVSLTGSNSSSMSL